jgi:hypothetical protein
MAAVYENIDLYTIANVNFERNKDHNQTRWTNAEVETFVQRAQQAAHRAATKGDFSVDVFTNSEWARTATADERVINQLASNPGVNVTFVRAPIALDRFFMWLCCLGHRRHEGVYRLDWSSPARLEMQK